MAETITIRPLQEADLPRVADLFNRTDYMPASEGYPISSEGLKRHLEESGTPLLLVAEDQEAGDIVGTLCLTCVSEQRVARPKEAFSSMFVVHPAYRNGSVANQLFIQMLYELLHRDYAYLSATVNPANVTALALYKRIGLFRTRDCAIDYDGELELCGYQPLLIKTMIRVCLPKTKKSGIVRREHAWRFLSVPHRVKLRESDYDTDFWHGLEVATYESTVDSQWLLFRFDVHSHQLVEMQVEEMQFLLYPEQGPEVCLGDFCSLFVSLTNLADSERTYGVTIKDLAPAILPEQPLLAQASWQCSLPFTPTRPGRHELWATLHTERGDVDFCTVVTAHYVLEVQRSEPLAPLLAGVPWQVPVQLTNRRCVPLQGTLHVSSPTLPTLRCEPETLSFAANETIEVTLFYPTPTAAAQRINEVTFQFIDTEGREQSVAPLVLPLLLAALPLVYRQEGVAGLITWTLESPALTLRLDALTGYARLWERESGKMVLCEPWSNLGPPLPGGLKRSPQRDLTFSVLKEVAGGEALLVEEHCVNGERLQRSFYFVSPHLLEIRQRWFPAAVAQEVAQPSRLWRSFGWCMLDRIELTIPLRDGWRTQQLIYGDYPFLRHEAETIPFGDLPLAADAYPDGWAAFVEDTLVIGTLWQDATEVRFGGHFLPSLVYALPAAASEPFYDLPPYAYYVGAGDARTIATVAQQWRSHQEIDPPVEANQYGVEQHTLLTPQQYEETLLSVLYQQSRMGDATVTTTYNERQGSYIVENGCLRWQVVPGFAGSLTSLSYQGSNLLQSSWPRTRLFGHHNPWFGGLYPGLIEDRTDLLQGLITDPGHLLDFTAYEISERDATGCAWYGIALEREDLRYSYETPPGLPLLRLSFEIANQRATRRECTLLLHLFLRSLRGSREPKRVYYEHRGPCNHLCNQLQEAQRSRHLYNANWSIVALGKETYVVLGAAPEAQLEIATYEWPHDGFEHVLLCPLKVAAGQRQRVACYLWITHSLEQAQAMLNALNPAGVLEY